MQFIYRLYLSVRRSAARRSCLWGYSPVCYFWVGCVMICEIRLFALVLLACMGCGATDKWNPFRHKLDEESAGGPTTNSDAASPKETSAAISRVLATTMRDNVVKSESPNASLLWLSDWERPHEHETNQSFESVLPDFMQEVYRAAASVSRSEALVLVRAGFRTSSDVVNLWDALAIDSASSTYKAAVGSSAAANSGESYQDVYVNSLSTAIQKIPASFLRLSMAERASLLKQLATEATRAASKFDIPFEQLVSLIEASTTKAVAVLPGSPITSGQTGSVNVGVGGLRLNADIVSEHMMNFDDLEMMIGQLGTGAVEAMAEWPVAASLTVDAAERIGSAASAAGATLVASGFVVTARPMTSEQVSERLSAKLRDNVVTLLPALIPAIPDSPAGTKYIGYMLFENGQLKRTMGYQDGCLAQAGSLFKQSVAMTGARGEDLKYVFIFAPETFACVKQGVQSLKVDAVDTTKSVKAQTLMDGASDVSSIPEPKETPPIAAATTTTPTLIPSISMTEAPTPTPTPVIEPTTSAVNTTSSPTATPTPTSETYGLALPSRLRDSPFYPSTEYQPLSSANILQELYVVKTSSDGASVVKTSSDGASVEMRGRFRLPASGSVIALKSVDQTICGGDQCLGKPIIFSFVRPPDAEYTIPTSIAPFGYYTPLEQTIEQEAATSFSVALVGGKMVIASQDIPMQQAYSSFFPNALNSLVEVWVRYPTFPGWQDVVYYYMPFNGRWLFVYADPSKALHALDTGVNVQ